MHLHLGLSVNACLTSALVVLMCSACGGEGMPGPEVDAGGVTGDGGPLGDGGPTSDGGPPSDGGPNLDAGARGDGGPGASGYQGTVSLTHAALATGEQTILGGFLTASSDIRFGALPGCTIVRRVGACLQATCSALDPSLSGGTLSARVEGVDVASSPSGTLGYFAMVAGAAFGPGDMVTLATTGGEVPAFSADVLAPAPLSATLPAAFVPGTDLVITWDSSAADEVELGLNGGTTGVVCAVAASEGSLTIDAAITADLSGDVPLSLKALNIVPVMAGTLRIAVIAADAIGGTMTAE